MNMRSKPVMTGIDRNREASDWLMKLQAIDADESEVAAWLKWCAADELNLEAFERAQRLYDQLQALPSDEKARLLRIQPSKPMWRRAAGKWHRSTAWVKSQAWLLGAGAVAASVLAYGVVTLLARGPGSSEVSSYLAPRGSQQALTLVDQSRVTLASASEIVSRFTRTTRYIELRGGEAYFEVQPDHSRPFVVRAGAMTVTAVGTKFNVRRAGARTIVSVTEGAVDVTADEQSDAAIRPGQSVQHQRIQGVTTPVRVRAGQQAVRAPETRGLVVSDVSPGVATAWQQGRLEYVLEPLSSVVADVNRYASRRIALADSRVGGLVFTGTIFIDRVDEWATTLPSAIPVTTAQMADGRLMLSGRVAGPGNESR